MKKKVTKTAAPKATEDKAPVTAKRGRKACAKKTAAKAVTFTVRAEAGLEVLLAGSFTDWEKNAMKMKYAEKDGAYTLAVKLAPGEYQYKFIIGGVWATDDQNMNQVANDQGSFNSVVTVL